MSRFEILLPYYGDVALMQDAVRSILAQDGDDWRLTVVDDGREAGVPEWFDGLADSRVRYYRNEQNLGVTGNFNRCVELAEYEYLVLMGCDDLMHPNYLQVVRAAADREPGAAMIQPGVVVIGSDGQPFDTLVDRTKRKLYAPKGPGRALLGGEELAASLLRGNWLYFPSICWRTEAVKRFGFRQDLGVIQDLALVIDLLVAGSPSPPRRRSASATAGTPRASPRPRPTPGTASRRPSASSRRPPTASTGTAGRTPPRSPGCTSPRGCTR
ncbi:glycosyltransferase [Kitasatospora gansuensis]